MKLNKKITKPLIDSVQLAHKMGVESLKFTHNAICGMNQERGTLLLQIDDIPNFPFDEMGISRIGVLANRLRLLDQEKVDIYFETEERDSGSTFVTTLDLVSGSTNIEFTCADPNTMRGKFYETLNFDFSYTFEMEKETFELMNRVKSVMQTENVNFIWRGEEVCFQTSDVEGDKMIHVVATEVVTKNNADDKFIYTYTSDTIIPALREAFRHTDLITVNIEKSRGVLNFMANNMNVYIMAPL